MAEEKTVEKDIIDLAYEIKKIIGMKPFDGKTNIGKGKICFALEASCLDKVTKYLEDYFGRPSYNQTLLDRELTIYSQGEEETLRVAGLVREKGYTLILAEHPLKNKE